MKRLFFKLLLFLVLGAIINVAVAWWCALPNEFRSFGEDTGENYGSFQVVGVDRFGERTVSYFPGEIEIDESPGLSASSWLSLADIDRYVNSLPTWSRFRSSESLSLIYDKYRRDRWLVSYHEHAAGWPAFSMRSCYVWAMDGNVPKPEYIGIEALGAPLRIGQSPGELRLPLRPIWPGFALNTFVYAVVLYFLFAIPLTIRRRLRTQRGLCQRCAYPIGTNDTCTECGGPIPARGLVKHHIEMT